MAFDQLNFESILDEAFRIRRIWRCDIVERLFWNKFVSFCGFASRNPNVNENILEIVESVEYSVEDKLVIHFANQDRSRIDLGSSLDLPLAPSLRDGERRHSRPRVLQWRRYVQHAHLFSLHGFGFRFGALKDSWKYSVWQMISSASSSRKKWLTFRIWKARTDLVEL